MYRFGVCNIVFLVFQATIISFLVTRYVQIYIRQKYENLLFNYYININYKKNILFLSGFLILALLDIIEMFIITKNTKLETGILFYVYLIVDFLIVLFLVELPNIVLKLKNKKIEKLLKQNYSSDDYEESNESEKFINGANNCCVRSLIGVLLVLAIVFVCGHLYVVRINEENSKDLLNGMSEYNESINE